MTVVLCLCVAVVAFAVGALVTRQLLRSRSVVDVGAQPVEQHALTVAELLDEIVTASPSAIVVVDRFRDVVLFNRRAEEFSLVREQLLDERIWAAASEALATDNDVRVEIASKTASSTDRTGVAIRCVVGVINGVRQDEKYAVIHADDDSENVRMEATRRDFVANVSHELKTPVGAIGLLAEALLESVDDPEAVQHFGSRVLAESTRMGNMVNELIALSRLQGAEKLPDLGLVEVDDIVNEAVTRAQVGAEAANITLLLDSASGLEVRGDDTLLLTAMSNLIANAIAYSPPQTSVSISRRLRPGTDVEPAMVEIAVTDRGIGIAPQDQERVFERFFRVDKARSRITGGTGLGLAIVKHVAANHAGTIKLWSKPGTGSTFTLQIPAAPSSESDDDEEISDHLYPATNASPNPHSEEVFR